MRQSSAAMMYKYRQSLSSNPMAYILSIFNWLLSVKQLDECARANEVTLNHN